MSLRYVQFVDALDFGDAVSNQVIRIHQMLLEKGEQSQIFCKFADPRVDRYRLHYPDFCMNEDTVILHHFCGYSEMANEISSWRGYKIMIYHNITPHIFFHKKAALYEFCKKGRNQLRDIINKYNLILGDSPFNCREAKELGAIMVQELPIIVPSFSTAISEKLIKNLRFGIDNIWLFVGRIAPNKRQDLLIDIFAHYVKLFPHKKNHLYLVGKYYEDDSYYNKVRFKINNLGLNTQVTLVGKVEDEDLPAYYKAADLFICMSEHEGFCVPIIEAFNNKLPVVAYAGTAVADTMGGGPGALENIDIESAVKRIHSVFTNNSLKNELVSHGIKQAYRFTPEAVRQRLYSIIDGITHGNGRKYPLRVSVVICTCNRYDYLKRCLNYLKDQNYPFFEVVVVNGPSTDNTQELLKFRKDIKVVQNSLRNLSISRNLGIRYASGDIVAFIDDDALPYDNWISEIVKRYNELPLNVVGVGGRTFFANQFRFQFEFGIVDSFGTHVEVSSNDPKINNSKYYRHLLGTNCSFRKDTLIAINGFDEQYDYYLDESDLAVRLQQAGGVIANANQAYIRHEFAQSHNRQGKYNFNWQVIAKNTAYFGIKNAKQTVSLPKRIWLISKNLLRERCLFFINAWRQQDLKLQEAIYYSSRTVIGALRGFYDSCFPRQLAKKLDDINSLFLPYIENQNDQENIEANLFENNKLHILIVSQEFPPNSFGGIGAYNQTLARELIQMGHEVTVISRASRDCIDVIGPFTHIQVATVENSDCIPESPILSKNIAWAKKVARIAQEIHHQRPISAIESALWDFEGIGILMLRPKFNVPLIVRLVTPLVVSIKMNGWQMTEDLKQCVQMEQELIRCADTVIAISNNIKNSVVSNYDLAPDYRWLVQPLGVQPWPAYTSVTNYGELPKDLKRGTIQILFVGRLEPRKGIDVFLKSLKLVMPKEPKIFVWIAGADIGGWEEKARQILGEHVYNRVQFLGMVSEEKRELLYANCDFLVFPSRYESFGLVPLEVMVHGKPVIGARAGAIPEVVLEGECGLLFEPDNYQELAQKILTLVNDSNLRCQLAKGAKQRVEILSARNMAKASVKVYRSLVNADVQMQKLDSQIIQRFQNNILSVEVEEDMQNNHTTDAELINYQPEQSVLKQSDDLSIRSDWSVTKPQIISWGWLNSIFNGFVVPKAVNFINSVLFESMQRQTYMNNALISNNKALENELNILKKSIADDKKNIEHLLTANQESIQKIIIDGNKGAEHLLGELHESIEDVNKGVEHQLVTLHESIEDVNKGVEHQLVTLHESIEDVNKGVEHQLVALHESIAGINRSLESKLAVLVASMEDEKQSMVNALVELKKLVYETQNLTAIENEMSRSEFIYQLKTQKTPEATIIAQEKIAANLHNLRLNLGCGQVVIPDYINVDQRELPGVDVISNIGNLPFDKGTVAEIFNSHVIEHFTQYEITNHILPYWYELLKDDGKIVIICPDAKSMILDYANGQFTWDNLRKVTYGSQDYEGNYHFNMYTSESLYEILSNCGFRDVKVVDTKRINGLCYEMEIHAFK
ncbi:glycosyltransferase [Nostoc sp. DedQUE09]|uniref:glycosyltransferase n=1 Tax=Nostoc sp. DedQUE09 TaxID=3075394 RepID=UPI002AD41D34|nr:glycosyltransferase [Nostoc sp. DedQUE09]MDZ7952786.1 glycosyltransferase [Nostoc sp. DedQUE09]